MSVFNRRRRTLNQREKVLAAARSFCDPFTKEDLAVRAWELYPRDFGFRQHDLPNVQTVYCRFYGATGLLAQGRVQEVAPGRYRAV
jgi:hypothetical protein